MVEFINRVTESQASDKVHKVLRTDPDKKRNQSEREKSETEKKEEAAELKDTIVLSENAEKTATDNKPDNEPAVEMKVKNKIPDKKDSENPSGHIDVTA